MNDQQFKDGMAKVFNAPDNRGMYEREQDLKKRFGSLSSSQKDEILKKVGRPAGPGGTREYYAKLEEELKRLGL